jgi:hypothetical protein
MWEIHKSRFDERDVKTESWLTKAPPDERGGNRYVQPTATASHSDSTMNRRTRREHFLSAALSITDDLLHRNILVP